VSIAGFGKFMVMNRAARTGTNPKTGQPIDIPASKRLVFKPVRAITEALNAPD
jgi:nucleoid DNA-binding protein